MKKSLRLAEPFTFTKGLRTMKIEVKNFNQHYRFGTMLYDTEKDPYQVAPIEDVEVELKMANLMRKLMLESDAPIEQYSRIGLHHNRDLTKEELVEYKEKFKKEYTIDKDMEDLLQWEGNTK